MESAGRASRECAALRLTLEGASATFSGGALNGPRATLQATDKTLRETELNSPSQRFPVAERHLTKANHSEENEAALHDDITEVRHHMVYNNGRAYEEHNRISPADWC